MKVTFAGAIRSAFSNYVNFKGVSSRAQYWYFLLFVLLLTFVMAVFDSIFWPPVLTDDLALDLASAYSPLVSLALLVTFLPSLSVLSRRFRDAGWSGFWILTTFLPVPFFLSLFMEILNFGATSSEAQTLGAFTLFLLAIVVTLAVFIFQLVLCLLPTKSKSGGNRFAS
jgi:uncharacterized membrane protein YhaH (DUF805 family)